MKKIYHYLNLIAAVSVTVLVLLLGACEATTQQGIDSEKNVAEGDFGGEVYIKKAYINKHVFYLVFATCNGRPGHTVENCSRNHCFLRHSPDCPCHKVESSASAIVTDDAEDIESSDPFDF